MGLNSKVDWDFKFFDSIQSKKTANPNSTPRKKVTVSLYCSPVSHGNSKIKAGIIKKSDLKIISYQYFNNGTADITLSNVFPFDCFRCTFTILCFNNHSLNSGSKKTKTQENYIRKFNLLKLENIKASNFFTYFNLYYFFLMFL